MALSSQPVNGKRPLELYTEAVGRLTRRPRDSEPGGIFLITSCNFTLDELTRMMEQQGFATEHVVPTPSFTFGGVKGASVTTVAYRRV